MQIKYYLIVYHHASGHNDVYAGIYNSLEDAADRAHRNWAEQIGMSQQYTIVLVDGGKLSVAQTNCQGRAVTALPITMKHLQTNEYWKPYCSKYEITIPGVVQ